MICIVKKILSTILNIVSILMIAVDIAVVVYAIYVKVPFSSDLIVLNFILALYMIFIYVGKYGIEEAIELNSKKQNSKLKRKVKGKPKYSGRTNKILGGIAIALGILFALTFMVQAGDLAVDSKEYSKGEAVKSEVKIKSVSTEILRKKNVFINGTSKTRIVKKIDGILVKENKDIKFDDCSFYTWEIKVNHIYVIEYLPTTHRILSISENN